MLAKDLSYTPMLSWTVRQTGTSSLCGLTSSFTLWHRSSVLHCTVRPNHISSCLSDRSWYLAVNEAAILQPWSCGVATGQGDCQVSRDSIVITREGTEARKERPSMKSQVEAAPSVTQFWSVYTFCPVQKHSGIATPKKFQMTVTDSRSKRWCIREDASAPA